MLPINTILHPTDFSPHSDYAFRLACSLARDHGARLILLHVQPTPTRGFGEFGHIAFNPEDNASIREQMDRMINSASTVNVETIVRFEDVADEIVRVAEEKACDMIVLGTHGRTGLPRLLMGSVAEEVVRKAPCPVLTVKTPFPPVQAIRTIYSEPVQAVAGM